MNRSPIFALAAAVLAVLIAGASITGCGSSNSAPGRSVSSQPEPTSSLSPSRELTPDEVVRIQVEALRANSPDNSGIATAFSFASPRHRVSTGTLDHFIQLMHTPDYTPMLDSVEAEYFDIEVEGRQARQIVATTSAQGEVSFFLFELSRQTEGDYEGCWMTDSVSSSNYRIPSGTASSAST